MIQYDFCNNTFIAILALLATPQMFANVNGGCGVEWSDWGLESSNNESKQTIFCVWNPHEEQLLTHSIVDDQWHRGAEYGFTRTGQRFDDPHEDTQFLDTDLLLEIRSRLEN